MTIKKSGSDSGSKKTEDRKRTWLEADDAAHAIRELIRSMKMNPEHKITLDDGITESRK